MKDEEDEDYGTIKMKFMGYQNMEDPKIAKIANCTYL